MRRVFWVLVVIALVGLATAWPRLSDVETGRTPEYPDLKVHEYSAGVEAVSRAAQKLLQTLPRWRLVGTASGPRGAALDALHEIPLIRIGEDVVVRVSSTGSRTRVSVRSRSRLGLWDLGQNARNIREFLTGLDAAVS